MRDAPRSAEFSARSKVIMVCGSTLARWDGMRAFDLDRDWLAVVTGGCGGEGNGAFGGAIDLGGCDDGSGAGNDFDLGCGGGAGGGHAAEIGCHDGGGSGHGDVDVGCHDDGGGGGGDHEIIGGCWGNAGGGDDDGGGAANASSGDPAHGYGGEAWSHQSHEAAGPSAVAQDDHAPDDHYDVDHHENSGTSVAEQFLGDGPPTFEHHDGSSEQVGTNDQHESSPYGSWDDYASDASGGVHGSANGGMNGASEYGAQPGGYSPNGGAHGGTSSDAYASGTTVDYGASATDSHAGGSLR